MCTINDHAADSHPLLPPLLVPVPIVFPPSILSHFCPRPPRPPRCLTAELVMMPHAEGVMERAHRPDRVHGPFIILQGDKEFIVM